MLEQLSQLWGGGAYGLPALSSAIESGRSAPRMRKGRANRIGTFSMEALPAWPRTWLNASPSVILIERF
jgi:hypothetical protein